MDKYIIIITVLGVAATGMAWMPAITKKIRISYSILYLLLGIILYSMLDMLPTPDPFAEDDFTMHLTELVVIISLMGTGLKIDQPFTLKRWATPLRLASITMILSIGIVAFIGWWIFQLDVASSILLGAALAPTDPVLASDVQVGPPQEETKSDVRFNLTAEAGLNDGMAFPFTWLAIAFTTLSANKFDAMLQWVLEDVVYRILAGVFVGYVMGRLFAYLLFILPEKNEFMVTRDGFIAVAATLTVYGVTEMIHGYGFIAVFIAALTLRNYEMHHKYHRILHDFTDQIERILVAIILILLGGAVVKGIVDALDWQSIVFTFVFIFIIRPLTAYVSVVNTSLKRSEKAAISFFGIRGMGSFFYLAFAITQAEFFYERYLWGLITFVIVSSIIIHGLTATYVMNRIEKR